MAKGKQTKVTKAEIEATYEQADASHSIKDISITNIVLFGCFALFVQLAILCLFSHSIDYILI